MYFTIILTQQKQSKELTLHKLCESTGFYCRFCPYTGEYGSVKTLILAYFMQCKCYIHEENHVNIK